MKTIICTLISVFILSSNIVYGEEIHNDTMANKIILIDPGHGGQDGGAIGKDKTLEKDLNLKISLKVRELLKDSGYTVYMTREDDRDLHTKEGTVKGEKIQDLKTRCDMKDKTGCELFISIHMNNFTDSKPTGPHVYYANNEKSKFIADILINNLIKDLEYPKERESKPAKNAYKILRNPKNGEVIVECGFMSNPGDLSKLKNDEYQDKIANSIKKSVDEYYNRYCPGNISTIAE